MLQARAPWWMYVIACSFFTYVCISVYLSFWGPEPLGLVAESVAGHTTIRSVEPDSPASRAGAEEELAEANRYLETEFIPWWNRTLAVVAREPQDAHRVLEKGHDLEAILSHVETRKVKTDYTFQFEAQQYVIEQADTRTGLRGTDLRVEKRWNGTIAVRFESQYLRFQPCDQRPKVQPPTAAVPEVKAKRPAPKSTWMKDFLNKKGPSIRKAIAVSNATS